MKKDLLIILLLLSFIIFGCTTTNKLRTGYQTVESVRGNNTVTFKGVEGDWHIESDTIKVGDVIYVKRTLRESKATIW